MADPSADARVVSASLAAQGQGGASQSLDAAPLAQPCPREGAGLECGAWLPIVDAHHHFWDLGLQAHPWLIGVPPAAFRYGDYAAIRRTYLAADYRRDTARFNVVKTVYVEAEWDQA